MAASIVIPVYNAVDFARRCIESIFQAKSAVQFEVIVVDNGSSTPVSECLTPENMQGANCRFIRFDKPLGFARAANEGARRGRYEHIVLLNSDTLVTDGWLDRLLQALAADPNLGIVSPVTNLCGHDPQMDPAAAALTHSGLSEFAAFIRRRDEVTPEPQRLIFFCVVIRRELWERLAGLDEIYAAGNYEDDDFCLRARLAGYQLAIVRSAFVFHEAGKTFLSNRIDHAEALARNQSIFHDRASRWSRALGPPVWKSATEPEISVIVPVTPSTRAGLRDSLTSLANQTVSGFEVVIAADPTLNLSEPLAQFAGRLRIVNANAPMLNAGVTQASGRYLSYLPAGDIFYPFHLEVLRDAIRRLAVDAAYSAWSIVSNQSGRERRGVVSFDQAAPERLLLGDWAPLICWMHSREAPRFDESLSEFTGWEFVQRLNRRSRVQYVRQVTSERRPILESAAPNQARVAEVRRVMDSLPVATDWQRRQRKQFLESVAQGAWEERLVIAAREVERRARRLLGPSPDVLLASRELPALAARLAEPSLITSPQPRHSSKPDIFLFSIIEWSGLTQRPHHFATGLASRGYRVFWIDVQLQPAGQATAAKLTSELEPGLHHVELPGSAGQIYHLQWSSGLLDMMELAFSHLQKTYGVANAIQLVNFPKWTPLVLRLRERFGWDILYDCLDDQQAFADLYQQDSGSFENELMRASRILITSSATLYEAHHKHHAKTLLIPNAANYEIFRNATSAGLLDHLPGPVIGYFGAFADWLDVAWIAEAARSFPAWSFVYIGREMFTGPDARQRWARATQAVNIHVFPQVGLSVLAACLTQFDVCTMPFLNIPVTRTMNAVKIYEYLAAGKPVVVPELPETRRFAEGLIVTYTDWNKSFRALKAAIADGGSAQQVAARRAFAADNDWAKRVDALSAALDFGGAAAE